MDLEDKIFFKTVVLQILEYFKKNEEETPKNDIKTYFDIEIFNDNSKIDFIDTGFENDYCRYL